MRRPAMTATLLLLAAAGCPSSESAPPETGNDAGQSCTSKSECRGGLLCLSSKCVSSLAAASTCAPPGAALVVTSSDLSGVPQTDPGKDFCATSAQAAVYGGNLVDFGTRKVGTILRFTVPPRTTGFSIVEQAVSAPDSFAYYGQPFANTPVPTDVKRPDGSAFFSDTVVPPKDARGYYDATGMLAYFMGYGPVAGVFAVPNTSAGLDLVRSEGQVTPGLWSFVVNDWAYECAVVPEFKPYCSGGREDSTYDVKVLFRTGAPDGDVIRSTGTLDLEIYLATASDTFASAAVAAASPDVARMLQTMRTYYARAGICIGKVTFHDLPGWAKDRYAPAGTVTIGEAAPCDPLSQLFTLAVGGTGPAVHLFLADKLADKRGGMPGYVTLGVDGSIPGPSGVPGTVVGGAIVQLFGKFGLERTAGACSGPPDPGNCGTDLVAYVAAHEAGHWLGLYHTTELTGDFFDPLADTSTCPCASCAPAYQRGACQEVSNASSPTVMENGFCTGDATCGGGRNLMFWVVDEQVSTGELTPEQGEVMRQNPAVR